MNTLYKDATLVFKGSAYRKYITSIDQKNKPSKLIPGNGNGLELRADAR